MKITSAIIMYTVLTMTALGMLSCKKKVIEAKPSILGIWKGKFGLGTNVTPNSEVIFEIKDDGTLTVYNGADIATSTIKGTGRYDTLNGGLDFSGKYVYAGNPVNYVVEMTTTTAYTDLKGKWTFNGTAGGKIELKKQ